MELTRDSIVVYLLSHTRTLINPRSCKEVNGVKTAVFWGTARRVTVARVAASCPRPLPQRRARLSPMIRPEGMRAHAAYLIMDGRS